MFDLIDEKEKDSKAGPKRFADMQKNVSAIQKYLLPILNANGLDGQFCAGNRIYELFDSLEPGHWTRDQREDVSGVLFDIFDKGAPIKTMLTYVWIRNHNDYSGYPLFNIPSEMIRNAKEEAKKSGETDWKKLHELEDEILLDKAWAWLSARRVHFLMLLLIRDEVRRYWLDLYDSVLKEDWKLSERGLDKKKVERLKKEAAEKGEDPNRIRPLKDRLVLKNASVLNTHFLGTEKLHNYKELVGAIKTQLNNLYFNGDDLWT